MVPGKCGNITQEAWSSNVGLLKWNCVIIYETWTRVNKTNVTLLVICLRRFSDWRNEHSERSKTENVLHCIINSQTLLLNLENYKILIRKSENSEVDHTINYRNKYEWKFQFVNVDQISQTGFQKF